MVDYAGNRPISGFQRLQTVQRERGRPMSGSGERAPPAFHVMAKPTGARCNLDCAYCFFLKKEGLYPGSSLRMTGEVMEEYIRQTITGHCVPEVTIAWQGGEPPLMGLDFFRRAVEVQKKYAKPGTRIENTFQTNGILLDDDWCRFFHDELFAPYIQFIPIVERENEGNTVTDRSIRPEQWRRFLIGIFDAWINIVLNFDWALAGWQGRSASSPLPAALAWRSSITATSTPVTTSSNRTTSSATSSRHRWSSL